VLRSPIDAFGGNYQGSGAQLNIVPFGAGALVQLKDKGQPFSGVGIAFDGFFAASTSKSRQAGVTVYRIQPGGRLAGVGVTSNGAENLGVLAENLVGGNGLTGVFTIASATDAAGRPYGGTCTIAQLAPDVYQLAWKIGSRQFSGIGWRFDGKLWTAWSPESNAFLTVLSRVSQKDYYTLNRYTLYNTGAGGVQQSPVTRVK
jgi:hypothetical protein